MNKYRYTPVKGVGINVITDKRFKNEYFSISFFTPLRADENSLSYILPSLLLRGSEKYPRTLDICKKIQALYDAELGGESYRLGNAKVIKFSASYLGSDYASENMEKEIMELLREIILRPLKNSDGILSEKNTELEKNSVADHIITLINNKRSYAFSKCREIMLGDDPVAVSKYGTMDTLNGVSPRTITEFYEKILKNASVEFFYSGSANPEYISSLIQGIFGELMGEKSISLGELGEFIPPPEAEYFEKTEESDSEQSILCMGFTLPHKSTDDHSLRLFSEILSASPVSRLFMNIREKMGLCYFCDFNPISKKDRAIIVSGLEYERVDEAKKAILAEIEDIAAGNISEYEFDSARASLTNAYRGVFDSQVSAEGWELASLLLGRDETPEDVIEKILKVTPEDVSAAAKEIKLCTVFVLKEDT